VQGNNQGTEYITSTRLVVTLTTKHHHTMSVKIIRIEGKFEVIGYFQEGVLVRERKRIIRDWR